MAHSKGRRILIAGTAMALLAALGIWGNSRLRPEPRVAAPWLDFAPSEAQKRKMEELRSMLHPGAPRFPRQEVRTRASAPLFTYMAGTSDDDLVVQASLDAMVSAYGARSTKKEVPDRDVLRVLVKHLRSENPARVQAAFKAARIPLLARGSEDELVTEVIRLSREGKTPALRLAALAALSDLPPERRSASVLQAFLERTSEEPALAVTALLGLRASGPALTRHSDLADAARLRAEELTKAGDPGLRGTALELLVHLDPQARGNVSNLARERLTDADPYVRGMAAKALGLGTIGAEGDLHLLIRLVDDHAEATASVRGGRQLDGAELEIPRKVSGLRLVAECALWSMRALAERLERESPEPDRTGPERVGRRPLPRLTIHGRTTGIEQIQESAALMRAWYEAERAHLR